MKFLDHVEGFLHYKSGSFPFKYLELQVDANPKKIRDTAFSKGCV